MPINLQAFKDLYVSNPVLNLLDKKALAYTREEIAKELKSDMESISSKLRYLKVKRKVMHKKPYWISKKWMSR